MAKTPAKRKPNVKVKKNKQRHIMIKQEVTTDSLDYTPRCNDTPDDFNGTELMSEPSNQYFPSRMTLRGFNYHDTE